MYQSMQKVVAMLAHHPPWCLQPPPPPPPTLAPPLAPPLAMQVFNTGLTFIKVYNSRIIIFVHPCLNQGVLFYPFDLLDFTFEQQKIIYIPIFSPWKYLVAFKLLTCYFPAILF